MEYGRMEYARLPGIDKPLSRLVQGSDMLTRWERRGRFPPARCGLRPGLPRD